MLTQGKDDNEAGRKKDKQETANLSDREYNVCGFNSYNFNSCSDCEAGDVALSRQQRQIIIDSLVDEIGKDQYFEGFSVDSFAKTHGISKQSVYRYLATLEAESKIKKQKESGENKFKLIDTSFAFKYPLANLSEDIVWNKAIKPLLQDMSGIALRNCYYAFCEMLNNAIDHSEGAEVGICIKINAFSVSFQIIDDGIGIFEKIASAMHLEEKRFAILELAKGKYTSAPESHTGEGIFFSAKACDIFAIFSDNLEFSSLSFRGSEQLSDARISQPRGTAVFFSVFRSHSTPLSELFDQYTQDPDKYGFTKTVVPVKLLEYGDPDPKFISRSQAKRLLARFERFERIELDFTGVDEIGQGFADEIFRVFQNQHPNSRIIATNFSQRVRKMICRVTGIENTE